MRQPYNHIDPPANQRPLPVKVGIITRADNACSRATYSLLTALPTGSGGLIKLRLRTDSEHLARFFHLNWPQDTSGDSPDATVYAFRDTPSTYGLSEQCSQARWYSPDTRDIWSAGSEYYGNVKISVRGLCSELAHEDDMFVHGCALDLDGQGIVLSGMSGAGKTTLMAAIRKLRPETRIVNDDWGPLSLKTGTLLHTGEPHLHMKYPSVRAIARELDISPSKFDSENFTGDVEDTRARLMMSPRLVFGADGISASARLHLFVLVMRQPQEPFVLRSIGKTSLALLEEGQYSKFYDRTEHFMNGSLFLLDDSRREYQRMLHTRLLEGFPCIAINNNDAPLTVAARIWDAVDHGL